MHSTYVANVQLDCSASSGVAAESICEKMELKIIHIRLVTGSASNRLVAIWQSRCSLCCGDNKTKKKKEKRTISKQPVLTPTRGMCLSKNTGSNQRYSTGHKNIHISLNVTVQMHWSEKVNSRNGHGTPKSILQFNKAKYLQRHRHAHKTNKHCSKSQEKQ